MFAIWRVPAPWQPVTKKGQGQRMGGGKGAIDHYVTPIKAGRVILEMGGTCEFAEVNILDVACSNFKRSWLMGSFSHKLLSISKVKLEPKPNPTLKMSSINFIHVNAF